MLLSCKFIRGCLQLVAAICEISKATRVPDDWQVPGTKSAGPALPSGRPLPAAASQTGTHTVGRAGIPPWKAAWRRLLQRVITLEGTMCTPLQDLFSGAAGESGKLSWEHVQVPLPNVRGHTLIHANVYVRTDGPALPLRGPAHGETRARTFLPKHTQLS